MSPDDLARAFDVMLAGAIVVLAAAVLFVPGLYRSAVLFITFGLTLAVAWARLSAFDVALAEAAIGAGLLGALVVGAAYQFERARREEAGITEVDGASDRADGADPR
jgi:energy-converting hydrogenase B subunit D